MKFTISCLFSYRCYIPNLAKTGPVVHEKKTSMHDARRTTRGNGRHPITIGHLCDFVNQKSVFYVFGINCNYTKDVGTKMDMRLNVLPVGTII